MLAFPLCAHCQVLFLLQLQKLGPWREERPRSNASAGRVPHLRYSHIMTLRSHPLTLYRKAFPPPTCCQAQRCA